MIIIDEAHKLKNNKTKNYEFVQNLKKKFCLLVTATPIQNRIDEIFNLVSLLKPGHLGNEAYFAEAFSANKQTLTNDKHLRELVNKVMLRNRRGDTGIEWPKRIVKSVPIAFSDDEQKLYEAICELKGNQSFATNNIFSIITLQREACSSREAVYMTLKNMLQKQADNRYVSSQLMSELIDKTNQVSRNAKAEKVVELVQQINDKVIVFTEYRATQLFLLWYLKQHGITAVPFRGGFKRGKKDWMKELFKNQAKVLIATEAGGEGINLQFCNQIINYDLPWNPMRLEQRIGRIHRLGQERDVYIYNFAIKGTVEEHILMLLYEKINLFQRVIGNLDEILAKIDIQNIEEHIRDILSNSKSTGEMRIKMDNLTAFINFADQLKKEEDYNAATGNL